MGGNRAVIKPGRPGSDHTLTRLSISLTGQDLQCDLISRHLLLLLVLSGANHWLLFVKDETLTCEGSAIKRNVNFIWCRGLHTRFLPPKELHVILPSIMYQSVGCNGGWVRGGGRGGSNLQHLGSTNKNRTLKLHNRPSITHQHRLELCEVSFCFNLACFTHHHATSAAILVQHFHPQTRHPQVRDAFMFTFSIRT